MAGQAPSRRQLLQALACASLASGAPGFLRWSYAFAEADPKQTHRHAAPSAKPHIAHYTPRFFTAEEYRTVVQLAELILPRTPAGPAGNGARSAVPASEAGATDAGVAEFIDFMASREGALQTVFRQGLVWLDAASSPHTFFALAPAEQTSLLDRLAYKRNFRPEEHPGQEFFAIMRRYTVMGFYTSRIGLEALEYPGLRFYAESPSVPEDGSLERLGVGR